MREANAVCAAIDVEMWRCGASDGNKRTLSPFFFVFHVKPAKEPLGFNLKRCRRLGVSRVIPAPLGGEFALVFSKKMRLLCRLHLELVQVPYQFMPAGRLITAGREFW